jgi:hypothetical protein
MLLLKYNIWNNMYHFKQIFYCISYQAGYILCTALWTIREFIAYFAEFTSSAFWLKIIINEKSFKLYVIMILGTIYFMMLSEMSGSSYQYWYALSNLTVYGYCYARCLLWNIIIIIILLQLKTGASSLYVIWSWFKYWFA